ncbi:MAG: amino acid permease [Ferroplasma sp.]|uniref:APC family permease n=1 Tax=Ferroplasma sp. TaxID=2591003 RepID=UPI002814DB19|nr:amino acid permease [Ferroplasma sp.]WMT52212.1 MAG: amino acid permease [Ferroplasma sp.]
MASYELKRILGLRSAVIINLGAIIGAGIFVIIGIAAGKAGPAIILSIFISAIIAIFTGLSFSEIAQHISKEGGVYEYAKESFAPSAGFIGGTMWTFSNMIAISAVSLSMGSYINSLFHLHLNLIFYGIPVIIFFAVLNLLGIKNSARTLSILVVVNVIILIIFIISGLFYFKVQNFTNFAPGGFTGIMEGSALIFFAFTGFSRITTVGDEVKNPEKNIPKAIILSIVISSALYSAVAVVAIGLIPASNLASASAPLSAAINVLHNPYLIVIIAVGGITATAGVVLTGILGTSRVLFAMGRDREIPQSFGKIDKFGTPFYSILLSMAISLLFVYFVGFSTIIEASNVSVLIAYSIIDFSAIVLWKKVKRDNPVHLREQKYFFIIPLLGIVTIFITIAYLGSHAIEISLSVLLIVSVIYGLKYILESRNVIKSAKKIIPRISEVRVFGRTRYRIKK